MVAQCSIEGRTSTITTTTIPTTSTALTLQQAVGDFGVMRLLKDGGAVRLLQAVIIVVALPLKVVGFATMGIPSHLPNGLQRHRSLGLRLRQA